MIASVNCFKAGARQGGHRDAAQPGGCFRHGCAGEQVGLVEHDQSFLRGQFLQQIPGQGRGRAARVEHEQQHIRFFDTLHRLRDAEALDRPGRGIEPGGVNQAQAVGAGDDPLLDEITRCAGFGADDRALAADEAVEEGALAGVWLADDDGLDPIPQQIAVAAGRQQPASPLEQGCKRGAHRGLVLRGQILLGKIDLRLNLRQGAEQFVEQPLQVPSQSAAELSVGGRERPFSPGLDQIHHRLRLAQVHPPVEEGAPGEFSGLRRPAAPGVQILEDFLGKKWISVAGDFQHVLAGRRIRLREKGEENVVPDRAAAVGIIAAPGGPGRGRGAKNPGRNLFGIRPSDTDNGQRGGPRRRGEGGNGVGRARHISRKQGDEAA